MPHEENSLILLRPFPLYTRRSRSYASRLDSHSLSHEIETVAGSPMYSPMFAHEIETSAPFGVALLLAPPLIKPSNANLHDCTSSSLAREVWLSDASSASICCSWKSWIEFVGTARVPSAHTSSTEPLIWSTAAPPTAPVRSAEAVVKLRWLLPPEHERAAVAPIALATSAAETGQNCSE